MNVCMYLLVPATLLLAGLLVCLAKDVLMWLFCPRRRYRVRELLCRVGGWHDTIPLKRISKTAFVVSCMRCGWVYLRTTLPDGSYDYSRYRGQFDNFEDYAEEPAEAEPTFAEDDGLSV